jgi:hypothetical protein
MRIRTLKIKLSIGLIVFFVLILSCDKIGQEKGVNTTVNINDNENVIMEKFRNCPLGSLEILMGSILKNTNSVDNSRSETAWKCLYQTGECCDGMRCQFVNRFLWNKCKEQPLLFYMRYLEGDKNSIKFYRLATQYDIGAFEASDKITKKQFFNVLDTVKKEIIKYNNKHSINDAAFLKTYDEYLIEAKAINKQ